MAAEPQVGFAVVARNAAGRVIAEISQQVQGIAENARRGGLGRVFTGFGVSAANARRGATALETGLRALAIQATGATGALGQVGRAGLLLGGGWGIGIAASIGVAALAMRVLGKDAREAKERLAELAKEAAGLRSTPIGDLITKRGEAGEALRAAEERLASAQRGTIVGTRMGPEQVVDPDAVRKAQEDIAQARAALDTFEAELAARRQAREKEQQETKTKGFAQEIANLQKAAELGLFGLDQEQRLLEIRAELLAAQEAENASLAERIRLTEQLAAVSGLVLPGPERGALPGLLIPELKLPGVPKIEDPGAVALDESLKRAMASDRGPDPRAIAAANLGPTAAERDLAAFAEAMRAKFRTPLEEAIEIQGRLQEAFDAGLISAELYKQATEDLGQAHEESSAIAVAAISSLAGVAQSILRGDAGGVLSGAGGFLAGLIGKTNPIAGALVSLGSGLLGSVFGGGGDRRPTARPEYPWERDPWRSFAYRKLRVSVDEFGDPARRDLRESQARGEQRITIQILNPSGQIVASQDFIAHLLREQAKGGLQLLPTGFGGGFAGPGPGSR